MSKEFITAGLDIGSSSIKLLVVIKRNGNSDLEVLFRGEETSLGVRRGVVIDIDKVSRTIQILIEKARIETGKKINSAFVSIGGSHISCSSSRGMVAVSRADRNISREDVTRVLEEAAKAVPLFSNSEILETFPKEFIVDGIGAIKEVEGLQGNRLETEILVLSSFLPYKNNLIQAVLNADIQVLDVIPSVLAASSAVLSQRQKELGVAILDIGSGTSDLAVFEEGELIHFAVLPIGSGNITSDIAIGLKTDVDIAEAIKLKIGSCLLKGRDRKEKIEIEGEDPLIFSQKAVAKIIEARVSEILGEVQKELKKISKQKLLPAGFVLTGGGSKLAKIVELAKKELKFPCRLGRITNFSEIAEDLEYAAACGLALKGFDSGGIGNWKEGSRVSKSFFGKIKNLLKNFLP